MHNPKSLYRIGLEQLIRADAQLAPCRELLDKASAHHQFDRQILVDKLCMRV